MTELIVWLAILLFVVGFFVVMLANANKHLISTVIGWFLIIIGFVLAFSV